MNENFGYKTSFIPTCQQLCWVLWEGGVWHYRFKLAKRIYLPAGWLSRPNFPPPVRGCFTGGPLPPSTSDLRFVEAFRRPPRRQQCRLYQLWRLGTNRRFLQSSRWTNRIETLCSVQHKCYRTVLFWLLGDDPCLPSADTDQHADDVVCGTSYHRRCF